MENINTIQNIPDTPKKRIVIIGGGFAGLELAKKLCAKPFQLVMIDKNNYYQFQPLLYQIATAGLEAGSVSFPLRKYFQKYKNAHFRLGEVLKVNPEKNEIVTDIGSLRYDYLVIATGTKSNFFGLENIYKNALGMKSVTDAIYIRNYLLNNLEKALNETDTNKISNYLNIAIAGGGPTGVELAGALAEMKKYVFNKDYPELDLSLMKIKIFEGSDVLLNGMSAYASENAKRTLEKMGVEVLLNAKVTDYDGEKITLDNGQIFNSKTLIWATGVSAAKPDGFHHQSAGIGMRIKVDRYNRIAGYDNIFALGDVAFMETLDYPNGHPQVAPVALQQGKLLAKNFQNIIKNKPLREFTYKNKGTMATIGRNSAVADLPGIKLSGFIAWFLWSIVHLLSIVGAKNKVFVLIDWIYRYFTYDQSLRLLIKHKTTHSE
ncbi:MAG: NAD(P)/FAD-dependent oxidoreductase [Bacteroidetes bacterium]|nr:MAG: NAD(P)/FAD-dependent oxidoreductase [Bacteroidota bacterium]